MSSNYDTGSMTYVHTQTFGYHRYGSIVGMYDTLPGLGPHSYYIALVDSRLTTTEVNSRLLNSQFRFIILCVLLSK